MSQINSIEDINNLQDVDLMDIFQNIDFEKNGGDQAVKPIIDADVCPTCKTAEYVVSDTVQGNIVCQNCGQVLDNDLMDHNPEWRQYEEDGKGETARCSMPISQLLPQSSLGTSIAGAYRSRLKTLHGWSAMPYKERSLNMVLKEIKYRCQKGVILRCIEDDAKIMYKHISECKHIKGKNKGKTIIIRGKNRRSLIAACVFFACRKNGRTRSPKEIAELFELKYTEITKGCKTFLKLIKIKKMCFELHSSLPEHYVPRFCEELKIKPKYVEIAVQIAKNVQKLNVASDHTPISIASASILLMTQMEKLENISRKKIAEIFDVSEVTIIKTYKKIEPFKKATINDELTNFILKEMNKEIVIKILPPEVQKRSNMIKEYEDKTAKLKKEKAEDDEYLNDSDDEDIIDDTESDDDYNDFADDEPIDDDIIDDDDDDTDLILNNEPVVTKSNNKPFLNKPAITKPAITKPAITKPNDELINDKHLKITPSTNINSYLVNINQSLNKELFTTEETYFSICKNRIRNKNKK
jgi:transcription initiation factor TFIIIB Brf1 subunit/transcription initiation factor TFIIB